MNGVNAMNRAIGIHRWAAYQRERFPVLGHAPLVAAFSGSAVCLSAMLRGRAAVPPAGELLVAFVTSFLFFLQLRIADEFKDFAEDSRFRPYRPVPRGLVTLGELRRVATGAALTQLLLALWLAPSIVWLLGLVWIYLALMTREFFAAAWLRARPIAYMLSHMIIVPLVDLYATACDWWAAGLRHPPAGLVWFLIVSFSNGLVIEIGRKIRAPEDEEPGVQTYSVLWGRGGAVSAWLTAIGATAVCALQEARQIGAGRPVGVLLAVLMLGCVVAGERFVRRPTSRGGTTIETASGVWTVLMYLSLGAAPLAFAAWKAADRS
jgi:hypothetical protein